MSGFSPLKFASIRVIRGSLLPDSGRERGTRNEKENENDFQRGSQALSNPGLQSPQTDARLRSDYSSS